MFFIVVGFWLGVGSNGGKLDLFVLGVSGLLVDRPYLHRYPDEQML
jgi:hypothetical protein